MSPAARRACVVGWPVAHSRSPLVHRYWLQRYGIDGSYERAAVAPQELAAFLASLSANGYAGCNVTVPHKEAAFALLDGTDEAARRLGAANTLWLEDGRLFGTNTDTYGFLANLDAGAPGWDEAGGPAVMLGAGGAARAVAAGLADRGFRTLRIVNRNRARAAALARDLGIEAEIFAWDAICDALAGARLLVNATSRGMAGATALALDLAPLANRAVVSDIVYVPLRTPLLAAAEAAGHRAVDGLGMLLYQAVPGFARWFGRMPEVSAELRGLVARDIEAGR